MMDTVKAPYQPSEWTFTVSVTSTKRNRTYLEGRHCVNVSDTDELARLGQTFCGTANEGSESTTHNANRVVTYPIVFCTNQWNGKYVLEATSWATHLARTYPL